MYTRAAPRSRAALSVSYIVPDARDKSMEADDIVKVIQACTVALTLILGALGYGHAKKAKRPASPDLPSPRTPP